MNWFFGWHDHQVMLLQWNLLTDFRSFLKEKFRHKICTFEGFSFFFRPPVYRGRKENKQIGVFFVKILFLIFLPVWTRLEFFLDYKKSVKNGLKIKKSRNPCPFLLTFVAQEKIEYGPYGIFKQLVYHGIILEWLFRIRINNILSQILIKLYPNLKLFRF